MSRRLKRIVAIVALLLGVACLCYPIASNLIISAAQHQVADENIVAAEALDDGSRAQLYSQATEYNSALAAGMTYVSDPFDPDAPTPGDGEYFSALSIPGQEAMAVARIPSIDLYVPIYHGTADEVLQKGAGHLRGSSLPVGGASTHCVLAGHTGLPSVKIFDNLEKVDKGDYIFIEVLGETLCYQVTLCEVVEPQETSSLRIVDGEDLLTLVTCTPYGINSHRLLVHAQRCDVPDDAAVAHSNAQQGVAVPPIVLLAGVVAVVLAVAAIALRRWSARKAAHSRHARVGAGGSL